MTYPRWPQGPRRPEPPHPLLAAISLVAFFLAFMVGWLLLGCSGSSPSEIPGAVTVETAYGSVSVLGSLDPGEVRDGVERGYRDVEAQGYHLRGDGLTVVQGDGLRWHGRFYPDRDLIEVELTSDIRHEILHRAAWQLGRTGECRTLQGHSPGYDLDCRRLE